MYQGQLPLHLPNHYRFFTTLSGHVAESCQGFDLSPSLIRNTDIHTVLTLVYSRDSDCVCHQVSVTVAKI